VFVRAARSTATTASSLALGASGLPRTRSPVTKTWDWWSAVVVDLDLPVALDLDPRATQPERRDVGRTAADDKQVVNLARFTHRK
jgi:hypothetical protein